MHTAWRLLSLLLLVSTPALAADQPPAGGDGAEADSEATVNWMDTSQAVLTNRTQELTLWLDAFFGDPDYDLEKAESFLRLELINDWDEEDGNDMKARVRGKVQLPKLSHRLSLVFSGSDGGALTEEEIQDEEDFGLQYTFGGGGKSRFDATLAWAGGDLRPGVRFRNEAPLGEKTTYRYIQSLEYQTKEEFFTTGQLDFNRLLDNKKILRWSNRAVWGERTEGVEWRSLLALRQLWNPQSSNPVAISYYASVNGVTRPQTLEKNYRLGAVWRRQIYHDYLFLNLEPAWNYRRRELEDNRHGYWSFTLRLEVALEKDLRRTRLSE